MKLVFIVIVLLFTKEVISQTGTEASLTVLQKNLAEAKSIMLSNPAKSLQLATEVLKNAKNNKDAITEYIDVHNILGVLKMYSENFTESELMLKNGLELALQNNNTTIENKIRGNIGLLYFKKGDYQKSITASLEIIPKMSGNGKANTLANIAAAYGYLNQTELSIKYQLEAMEIFRSTKNEQGIAVGNNLLGAAYNSLNKPALALEYLNNALVAKRSLNDSLGIANTLTNLGHSYFLLKEYEKSKSIFLEAEVIFKALNNKHGLSKIYTNLGALAAKQQNFGEAKKQELNALKIAEKNNDSHLLDALYTNLGKTLEATNKDSAIAFKDKALLEKDSLMDITVQRQVAEMQTKYETSEKEKKIKEQELSITKRNYSIVAILGFATLAAVLGFSFFNRFKLKKKNELQQKINEQQEKATIDILAAEENERKRIASDLHDGVGQLMTAAWLNLQALNESNEPNKELLNKSMQLVDESCKEVRAISHNMMPNALLKKGLSDAVREFLHQINTKNLKINLQTEDIHTSLPIQVETVLYRIIQESVNNVVKHANANRLDISINQSDKFIDVMIEDDGNGFNFEEAIKKDGIGLQNIKSRIEYLKGTVEWNSTLNKGTLVAIHIPLQKYDN